MKLIKYILVVVFLLAGSVQVHAVKGVLVTDEEVQMLKEDLVAGKLRIGTTRLKDVRKVYGEAKTINNTDDRIIYDYGLTKLVWEKKKVWKNWEYDSFKDPVYSDSVDDLRFDLESGELIGKNITYNRILRSYDVPTESMETDEDGEMSIYYYGNIKLIFENQFVLDSWRGHNLSEVTEEKKLSR